MTTPTHAPTWRPLRALAIALLAAAAIAGVSPGRAAAADPAPLPACTRADDLAPYRHTTQWASTFLDTRFRLASSYVPPGLVSTANAGTNGGYRVRRLVIGDLRAMVSAAAFSTRMLPSGATSSTPISPAPCCCFNRCSSKWWRAARARS